MTMISQLYTKILLSVPLFSLVYYILSWAFIGLFFVFLVYHSYYKTTYQSSSLSGYSSLGQDSDDEDQDLQAFLKGKETTGDALNERIKHDKMIEQTREGQCWDN